MLSQQQDDMEVTALCFRLLTLEFILLGTQVQDSYNQRPDADFPRITPNRLQHFKYDPVSFDCGRFDGSTGLRVIKNTQEFYPECEIKWTSTGSFCTIDRIYLEDSGQYWCETNGGERSNSVNITVTDGSVILESPVLPVMAGDKVILHCRSNKDPTNLHINFYKNGILMEGSAAEEMTINNVTKSDEGLYKCIISDLGQSPESWLAVKGQLVGREDSKTENNTVSIIPPPAPQDHLSDVSYTPDVLILLWISVTILMLVLVLLLVGFLHFRKHKVFSKSQKAAASRSGEDNQTVDVADDPNDVTYAVVITKQRKDKDSADAADNLSPCLEKNHDRKPQGGKDEDESSQPVYSALTISEAPQAAQPGLSSSSAATYSNTTDPEVLYSPIVKNTKS